MVEFRCRTLEPALRQSLQRTELIAPNVHSISHIDRYVHILCIQKHIRGLGEGFDSTVTLKLRDNNGDTLQLSTVNMLYRAHLISAEVAS